jgi:hypothetical protein
LLDLHGHCRLREVQFFGGARVVQVVGHFFEYLKLAQSEMQHDGNAAE